MNVLNPYSDIIDAKIKRELKNVYDNNTDNIQYKYEMFKNKTLEVFSHVLGNKRENSDSVKCSAVVLNTLKKEVEGLIKSYFNLYEDHTLLTLICSSSALIYKDMVLVSLMKKILVDTIINAAENVKFARKGCDGFEQVKELGLQLITDIVYATDDNLFNIDFDNVLNISENIYDIEEQANTDIITLYDALNTLYDKNVYGLQTKYKLFKDKTINVLVLTVDKITETHYFKTIDSTFSRVLGNIKTRSLNIIEDYFNINKNVILTTLYNYCNKSNIDKDVLRYCIQNILCNAISSANDDYSNFVNQQFYVSISNGICKLLYHTICSISDDDFEIDFEVECDDKIEYEPDKIELSEIPTEEQKSIIDDLYCRNAHNLQVRYLDFKFKTTELLMLILREITDRKITGFDYSRDIRSMMTNIKRKCVIEIDKQFNYEKYEVLLQLYNYNTETSVWHSILRVCIQNILEHTFFTVSSDCSDINTVLAKKEYPHACKDLIDFMYEEIDEDDYILDFDNEFDD